MHTLYKLTFKSGKSYIGQTLRKLSTRITQHKASSVAGSNLPVHCAWRVHGDPIVEILCECETPDDLHEAEILAIQEHKTLSPNGYNVALGGGDAPSKTPSVAKKISEKAIGRKMPEAAKNILREKSRKNWENPEYRANVLEKAAKGITQESRSIMSKKAKDSWAKRKQAGFVVSEETKAKLKNRVFSDEARLKMSMAAKGRKKAPRTKETCEKLSNSMRSIWSDPTKKERRSMSISEALKNRFANMTDEQKKEFSDMRKKAWETRRKSKTQ